MSQDLQPAGTGDRGTNRKADGPPAPRLGTPSDDRPRMGRPLAVFVAMRPHQWAKNVLLFLPLVAGHHVRDLKLLAATALGFLAFSLSASAVYVLNDLFDLRHDREHPTKRNRPFASGALP